MFIAKNCFSCERCRPLPLVQYFLSFHLAQEKMKELTGPGKWEQWTHWKTKTQDHRNRGAAKGELEKILSAEPVSSQRFRQNSVCWTSKFPEVQTKFCLLQPQISRGSDKILLNQQDPRGSDKFLSPTTVNFQRFRQNSVCWTSKFPEVQTKPCLLKYLVFMRSDSIFFLMSLFTKV